LEAAEKIFSSGGEKKEGAIKGGGRRGTGVEKEYSSPSLKWRSERDHQLLEWSTPKKGPGKRSPAGNYYSKGGQKRETG